MSADLQEDVSAWDGKSSDDIKKIFSAHQKSSSFIADIISLMSEEQYQKAVSWLLKHYLESGGSIKSSDIHSVYRLLPTLSHWESILHLLQCIPYLPISPKDKNAVNAFVRQAMTHSNKFVRAWSYSGLHELACQFPEYKKEAQVFFDRALKEEAASIKARIRNILK